MITVRIGISAVERNIFSWNMQIQQFVNGDRLLKVSVNFLSTT